METKTTPQSIIEQLQRRIESMPKEAEVRRVGEVTRIADGIASVSGLTGVVMGEMVRFEKQRVSGLALNLGKREVGVVILGDWAAITVGDTVASTGEVLAIPVGDNLIGRVVDPLGMPIDGKGEIHTTATSLVEKIAPGVMSREPVSVPLQTGIKAIDAMIPIGRGQRELIIGDRQTGKTAIALDAIINQNGQNVICVYVAIGQKESKVARIVEKLRERGALTYTVIVSAGVAQGAAASYIAPYAATAIAEYFMEQGRDVLIVYDDLSKHAVAYRELSLLLRRPPGREAYPGDVFYLHSRLLERACRRNKEHGGGSITALPIIETQAGDVSAYIPTNVISITDGQIFLEAALFNKGLRPAVNVGLSVSRVGGAAQIKSMKRVAGTLKLSLAQYRELEAFTQFASDLDPETKKQLDRGIRLTELLKQPQYAPIPTAIQVALLYAGNQGVLDALPVDKIGAWEADFSRYLQFSQKELLEALEGGWDEAIEGRLQEAIKTFMQTFTY
jgi:F-type H+-transporting ATPase subunit alpha